MKRHAAVATAVAISVLVGCTYSGNSEPALQPQVESTPALQFHGVHKLREISRGPAWYEHQVCAFRGKVTKVRMTPNGFEVMIVVGRDWGKDAGEYLIATLPAKPEDGAGLPQIFEGDDVGVLGTVVAPRNRLTDSIDSAMGFVRLKAAAIFTSKTAYTAGDSHLLFDQWLAGAPVLETTWVSE